MKLPIWAREGHCWVVMATIPKGEMMYYNINQQCYATHTVNTGRVVCMIWSRRNMTAAVNMTRMDPLKKRVLAKVPP